jgi:hypothetical protein
MDREFSETDDLFNEIFEPFLASPSQECSDYRRRCVVAIPVKDEEQRLPACLSALANQRNRDGRPVIPGSFGIVVFANNCRDRSASLARSLGAELSLPVRVVEASLPPAAAHAGIARRAAMDIAEAWLGEENAHKGVILTTDADSRVSADWIATNLAAIDAGADAVLGDIALDEEGDLLPPALHRRGELESAYEALLTELSALLDPLDHNPWPHHATISAATIAITRDAYLAVGGLPRVPITPSSRARRRGQPQRAPAPDSSLPGLSPKWVTGGLIGASRRPFRLGRRTATTEACSLKILHAIR